MSGHRGGEERNEEQSQVLIIEGPKEEVALHVINRHATREIGYSVHGMQVRLRDGGFRRRLVILSSAVIAVVGRPHVASLLSSCKSELREISHGQVPRTVDSKCLELVVGANPSTDAVAEGWRGLFSNIRSSCVNYYCTFL